MPPITAFKGESEFLSNFYFSPVKYGGIIYPTVEHAYQAAKSTDRKERLNIRDAATPGIAKKLGQQVALRKNWDKEKVYIMKALVLRKFKRPELQKKLLATGNSLLIEGNWWKDQFWGVYKGVGLNTLGIILMSVRDYYND